MQWTITRDIIQLDLEGVTGPTSTATLTHDQIKAHPDAKGFRLLDDDGEVYCIGKAVWETDDTGFEPLDEYGAPSLGVTEIQWLQPDGSWEPW